MFDLTTLSSCSAATPCSAAIPCLTALSSDVREVVFLYLQPAYLLCVLPRYSEEMKHCLMYQHDNMWKRMIKKYIIFDKQRSSAFKKCPIDKMRGIFIDMFTRKKLCGICGKPQAMGQLTLFLHSFPEIALHRAHDTRLFKPDKKHKRLNCCRDCSRYCIEQKTWLDTIHQQLCDIMRPCDLDKFHFLDDKLIIHGVQSVKKTVFDILRSHWRCLRESVIKMNLSVDNIYVLLASLPLVLRICLLKKHQLYLSDIDHERLTYNKLHYEDYKLQKTLKRGIFYVQNMFVIGGRKLSDIFSKDDIKLLNLIPQEKQVIDHWCDILWKKHIAIRRQKTKLKKLKNIMMEHDFKYLQESNEWKCWRNHHHMFPHELDTFIEKRLGDETDIDKIEKAISDEEWKQVIQPVIDAEEEFRSDLQKQLNCIEHRAMDIYVFFRTYCLSAPRLWPVVFNQLVNNQLYQIETDYEKKPKCVVLDKDWIERDLINYVCNDFNAMLSKPVNQLQGLRLTFLDFILKISLSPIPACKPFVLNVINTLFENRRKKVKYFQFSFHTLKIMLQPVFEIEKRFNETVSVMVNNHLNHHKTYIDYRQAKCVAAKTLELTLWKCRTIVDHINTLIKIQKQPLEFTIRADSERCTLCGSVSLDMNCAHKICSSCCNSMNEKCVKEFGSCDHHAKNRLIPRFSFTN